MNLIASIPSGQTEIMVNGLHQWDYGRKLEIRSSDLPALVEVHFACPGMQEAVVRSCSVTSGVTTAAIPDICLEQTAPIMAWVYEVGSTSGTTLKTIALPITARTRPQPAATVPTTTSDKYTEAIGAMNDVIASVSKGSFTAARAISDEQGRDIYDTYATKKQVSGTELSSNILDYGLSLVGDGKTIQTVHKYINIQSDKWTNAEDYGLPHAIARYGYVTYFIRWQELRVIAWCADTCSIYYNSHNGNRWIGWRELIDSNNIEKYRKTNALVDVQLTMVNEYSDNAPVDYDFTYYQDGVKKTASDSVPAGRTFSYKTHKITVDLGSEIHISAAAITAFGYISNDIPFISRKLKNVAGAYDCKERFIVIGGGIARFELCGPE